MTADPCAHDRWKGAADVVSQAICSRCSWSANDIIAALRARAEQAEQERGEARQELDDRYGSSTTRRTMQATIATLETRYDRLREAAREVVEGMKCWACGHDVHEPDICKAASPSLHICIHGQPMKRMSANWWDSYSKLAEEVGETTQKPAGLGGPSEGGR